MIKEIQIGEIIQGAEIIKEGCYWDNDGQLIIPNGKYLGDYLTQLPYGRIDKRITGIGATSLELKSDRNSIIVVPTQHLAYSKSLLKKKYKYVGGDINSTGGSPTQKDITDYINNDEIVNKKLLVVADSLKRVFDEIENELDNWFIVIDEIDTFQEQANFRAKLEGSIDYYLLFDREKRCLLSATLKDFSNKELMKDKKVTFNNSEITNRKLKIINTENIYHALINKILRYSSNIIKGSEKIVVAYNSVIDAYTIINILPEHLRGDCRILCSKSRQFEVGDYYGELQDGRLSGKINFVTSAYYAGIDFYDSYHLIYVADIKKPHTLFSVDKINQIYGRCRENNGENKYAVLSETLINNSDGKIKNKIVFTHKELLDKAEIEALTLDCIRTKMANRNLGDSIAFQKYIISLGNHFDINLTRFKFDNTPLIAYFNIDSYIENQRIRQVVYESGITLNESFENSGFNTERIDLPYPEYVGEDQGIIKNIMLIFVDKKDKSTLDIRNMAFTNIQNGENTYLLMDNSKEGEEKRFYILYNRLKEYVNPDQLLLLFETIKANSKKNSFTSKALKNIEICIKYQTLNEDTPFIKSLKDSIRKGQNYSGPELVKSLSRIYQDIGATKVHTVQTAMEELNKYVKFRQHHVRRGFKRIRLYEVINYNPCGIILKEGVENPLWIKNISKGTFSFDTIY